MSTQSLHHTFYIMQMCRQRITLLHYCVYADLILLMGKGRLAYIPYKQGKLLIIALRVLCILL